MSGSLNFGLLKKIIDSVRGFDGEKSGISGHFALRTKCCFTMNGQKRSLDVQAPSEAVKDDWVSAIKLMVAYYKLGSLSTPAERAKLEEALESRRFVREALKNKKKKRKEKKQSIFMSFAPKRFFHSLSPRPTRWNASSSAASAAIKYLSRWKWLSCWDSASVSNPWPPSSAGR